MIEKDYLRKSSNGIAYLDFSDFMNVFCGIVLNNENRPAAEIEDFILKTRRSYNGNSQKRSPANFNLIQLNQKHTNIVISSDGALAAPADGAITRKPENILTIRTADCFPVYISDGKTVGLLHLGWRSVFAGILGNFFDLAVNLDRKQAKVIIGPGIGECCFEVTSEVALLFDKKYHRQKDNRFFIDLRRLILDELAGFGIKYILSSESCTACSDGLFHSYRREGANVKHMISYICLGG
ncbi:MAG: polyphenol oxidase family protein [candidate division Zixibacteria bacterium]|nr:polyphenol oxidase family protein [candidate division Zixibacteria bacterium]